MGNNFIRYAELFDLVHPPLILGTYTQVFLFVLL